MASGPANPRKRPAHELDNYTNISEPLKTANLHGVVKTLSPVKKGRTCKYFDGTITDGTSSMRFVGFRQEHRKQLFTLSESKTPVALQDCEVQLSRKGNQLEILLKNGTAISPSKKTFEVCEGDDPTPITLAQTHEAQLFDKISADVKVLRKKDPIQLPSGKTKQDLLVGDRTSTITVTLWEQDVDTMSPDCSYHLQNFLVKEFNMQKFLSMPKEGASIISIEDIGEVQHAPDPEESDLSIREAQIVGVPQLHSYNACLQCKARVEPLTPPLGRCSKPDCSMIQRYDICPSRVSAKLLFMYGSTASGSKQYKSLHAFGATIGQIANVTNREVTASDLLASGPFTTITYNNNNNAITGFTTP